MIVSDSLHNRSNGNPISGVTVELFRASDDGSLGTTTTNADGVFTFDLEVNPGPTYYKVTIGDTTKRHSTFGTQPVRDLDLSALVPWQTIWSNGVNPEYGSALAVTANGSNMVLTVGSGAGIADGQPFYLASPITRTVTTAHASQPRIDLLYAAVYNADSADMGKVEVVLLAGTPSSSPAAPAPTITNGEYIPLAEIRVDASVTSIASNKVTDKRVMSRPASSGVILERDNVKLGTIPGIDVKNPMYATYYANDVADIGVYRGALTPVEDTAWSGVLADVSTTTETKFAEIDQSTAIALHTNQNFRLVVDASVNGEGITALVDGQIGIKVGTDPIVWTPTQRWEHGVDTTHRALIKKDLIGAGAKVPVEVWWKRISGGTFSPNNAQVRATFTPRFTAGT